MQLLESRVATGIPSTGSPASLAGKPLGTLVYTRPDGSELSLPINASAIIDAGTEGWKAVQDARRRTINGHELGVKDFPAHAVLKAAEGASYFVTRLNVPDAPDGIGLVTPNGDVTIDGVQRYGFGPNTRLENVHPALDVVIGGYRNVDPPAPPA